MMVQRDDGMADKKLKQGFIDKLVKYSQYKRPFSHGKKVGEGTAHVEKGEQVSDSIYDRVGGDDIARMNSAAQTHDEIVDHWNKMSEANKFRVLAAYITSLNKGKEI